MLEGNFRNKLDLIPTLKKRENYPPLDNVEDKLREITEGKDEPAAAKDLQDTVNAYKDRELQPGEEPDTKSALGIDFEETGIPPAGWKNICPYNTGKYPLKQIGLSRLFADWAKGRAWYDPVAKGWYVRWDKKLVLDTNKRHMCDLRSEFQKALDYAESRIQNPKFKEKFHKKFGDWFESDAKWDKVLDGARAYCSVDSATKDTDRYIIATPGKIIRLNRKDGSISVRDMEDTDFVVRHLGVEYDPDATCPTFMKLLDSSLQGDKEKIRLLQMMFGLTICGNNEQRAVIIIYGLGTSNGKSTLLKASTDTLGDYAAVTRSAAIDGSREGNSASSDTIAIKGKRMVCVHEINQGAFLDAGKVKQIASGDHMAGREVFQSTESFVPQCVLFMDCNALPRISDLSLFDRDSLIVISFNKSFKGKEQDTSIAEKLEKEHAGILNWMLEGFSLYCKAYPEHTQIVLPKSVYEDTMAYRDEYNVIKMFYESCILFTDNQNHKIENSEMRSCYEKWAKSNGYPIEIPQVFNVRLQKLLGITQKLTSKSHSQTVYRGFMFRPKGDSDPSGFFDYLEAEYRKTNISKGVSYSVSTETMYSNYLTWAEQQGIAEILNANGMITCLMENGCNFDYQDNHFVITGIRKVVADKDVDCASNQLEM